MNKHSFNLIELVVSVIVFALLAAVLLPAFSRARAESRISACRANLLHIGNAIELYGRNYQRYPDEFPRKIEKELVHHPAALSCPAGGGYGFAKKMLGKKPSEAHWDDIIVADSDSPEFVVGSSAPPDTDRHADSSGRTGFNALRADGSVKFIPTP
ncbi:MAG: hypothetical protein AB7F40_07505 [Victivallaceae bacterium]|nr:hypothetical protein [Victivallaceae bacterium]